MIKCDHTTVFFCIFGVRVCLNEFDQALREVEMVYPTKLKTSWGTSSALLMFTTQPRSWHRARYFVGKLTDMELYATSHLGTGGFLYPWMEL